MSANRTPTLNGGATTAAPSDGSYVMNELHALKVPPRRPGPRPEHLHRLVGHGRILDKARRRDAEKLLMGSGVEVTGRSAAR